jgi:hypothetical protein
MEIRTQWAPGSSALSAYTAPPLEHYYDWICRQFATTCHLGLHIATPIAATYCVCSQLHITYMSHVALSLNI